MQVRRGDKAHATLRDEKLREGQPFYEMDTHRLKIGDGKSTYNQLPYVGAGTKYLKQTVTIPKEGLNPGYIVATFNDDYIKEDSLIFINPILGNGISYVDYVRLNLSATQEASKLTIFCNNSVWTISRDISLSIEVYIINQG